MTNTTTTAATMRRARNRAAGASRPCTRAIIDGHAARSHANAAANRALSRPPTVISSASHSTCGGCSAARPPVTRVLVPTNTCGVAKAEHRHLLGGERALAPPRTAAAVPRTRLPPPAPSSSASTRASQVVAGSGWFGCHRCVWPEESQKSRFPAGSVSVKGSDGRWRRNRPCPTAPSSCRGRARQCPCGCRDGRAPRAETRRPSRWRRSPSAPGA